MGQDEPDDVLDAGTVGAPEELGTPLLVNERPWTVPRDGAIVVDLNGLGDDAVQDC